MNKENPLLIMATGTGKTIVMASLAQKLPGHTLFLAHRDELISQLIARFHSVTGAEPSREQSVFTADKLSRYVVASVQTMQKERLKRWDASKFSFIFTDEAHHSAARSYKNIYSHFFTAQHIGATATPDRADGSSLPVYTKIGYQYPLHKAIRWCACANHWQTGPQPDHGSQFVACCCW
ncbi:MAG: DEAD/DEAH box helicase family protein [Candidatus Competibacteraceae bacterium]|nr:DEAD/DEAH box helicase family protein [Candidatus Competibacteraceae bacterium]